MTYLGISDLSGEHTIADLSLIGKIEISDAVLMLFGGGGTLYGLRQRKIRRDTIESLSGRQAEYEKKVDPKRSSSQLTKRGTTPPEKK